MDFSRRAISYRTQALDPEGGKDFSQDESFPCAGVGRPCKLYLPSSIVLGKEFSRPDDYACVDPVTNGSPQERSVAAMLAYSHAAAAAATQFPFHPCLENRVHRQRVRRYVRVRTARSGHRRMGASAYRSAARPRTTSCTEHLRPRSGAGGRAGCLKRRRPGRRRPACPVRTRRWRCRRAEVCRFPVPQPWSGYDQRAGRWGNRWPPPARESLIRGCLRAARR